MRHGGAAVLWCCDLKRQILVHGPLLSVIRPGQLLIIAVIISRSSGSGCALWARRKDRWDASAGRQAQGAGKAHRGHQSVAEVVAFLRTSALPHPVDTLTTSPAPKSEEALQEALVSVSNTQ